MKDGVLENECARSRPCKDQECQRAKKEEMDMFQESAIKVFSCPDSGLDAFAIKEGD